MWLLKIKIKHNCTIGSRCEHFGCMSYSFGLSAWREKKYEFTAQKHHIFGPAEKVEAFIEDLRNDPRILNLKAFNSEVYFIEKRRMKEVPSSYHNSKLYYLKPVYVDIYGWETWELVSRKKGDLEAFIEGIQTIKSVKYKIESFKKYNVKNSLLSIKSEKNFIISRIEGELDRRLTEQLKTGYIEGDQWFRDFRDWFVIAFNNPYNYKHPNSELVLLESNRKDIEAYIQNYLQIHYGVGVGETELELVRWQLEASSRLDICAIDINRIFLELFIENLKNKQIEFPQKKIFFRGYNTTFQNTNSEDFIFQNKKFSKRVHICLGGTIGNFRNQDEIWTVFNRNANKGDRLLLAFQLDSHINEAFLKYRNNKYYADFVLSYFNERIDRSKIRWQFSYQSGYIVMNYKGMEVFRTKKYSVKKLTDELKKFDFKLLKTWADEYKNTCIIIFEKIK